MAKNSNAKVAEAGIIGAVIGAAVGAGAVALSSEKNRKVLKNKFNELKKEGGRVLSDLQSKAEKFSSEGKKSLGSKAKEIKKSIKAKI